MPQREEENMVPGVGGSGKEWENPPEDNYHAVCCDLALRHNVKTAFGEKSKIRIYFQLDATDSEGKRFLASQQFTYSMHGKSTLRKFVESWRGKKFTDEEANTFNLAHLLGQNALVQVVHNTTGEKVYANVETIMRPGPSMPKLVVSPDYVRLKDRPSRDERQASNNSNAPQQEEIPF